MATLVKKMASASKARWTLEDSNVLRQLMESGEVGVDDKPADILLKFPNFNKFGIAVFRTHLSLLKRENICER
jgi:hypothetical protein